MKTRRITDLPSPHTLLDGSEWIEIVDLEVYCHVGITPDERQNAQRLLFSLRFQLGRAFASLGERLTSTIDYCAVRDCIRGICASWAPNLIETLVDGLANQLMDSFPMSQLEIECKKFVLADAAFVRTRTARIRN